jgi:hypothetical protein
MAVNCGLMIFLGLGFSLAVFNRIKYQPKVIEIDGDILNVFFLNKYVSPQKQLILNKNKLFFKSANKKELQIYSSDKKLLARVMQDALKADDWKYIKGEIPDSLFNKMKMSIFTSDKSIKYVKNIEMIKAMLNYTNENIKVIDELIKAGKIDEVIQIPDEKKLTHSDISIIKFYDQNDRLYVATMYDNWDLWQDPQLMKIYPM